MHWPIIVDHRCVR